MLTESLPVHTTESAVFCFVFLARENDHLVGFRAWIPERSDFFNGPKGPKGPLGLERSDFFRGPKGPKGPLGPERSDFFKGPKGPLGPGAKRLWL